MSSAAEKLLSTAKDWNTAADGPQDDAAIAEFLKQTQICRVFACKEHPGGKSVPKTVATATCEEIVHNGKRNVKCRVALQLLHPYYHGKCLGQITLAQKFTVWRLLALNVPLFAIHYQTGLSPHGSDTTLSEVLYACEHYVRCAPREPSRFVQIDETFIGKRKFHQGKRVRKAGFWFMTATYTAADGSSTRTIWQAVKDRSRETCEAFVQSVADSRSIVTTDGWKGYLHIGEFVKEHKVVIHNPKDQRQRFTNKHGDHTNNAEGAHNVVKCRVRRGFYHHGQGKACPVLRVALACVLFGKKTPGERLHALLTALRYHSEHFESDWTPPDLDPVDCPDHLEAVATDSDSDSDKSD